MKSYFLLLLICFAVCFLFVSKDDDEIRVRVISNSESVEDVAYKNEVVRYLKDEIFKNTKLNNAYFKKNYKNIEQELNDNFKNIVVEYQNHTFINKTYNGSAEENGEYMTLVIYIGQGLGENWWGSIFDETLQYESSEEVRYEWYLKRKQGELNV